MLNASLVGRNASPISSLITILDKCKSMFQLKQIHVLLITLGLSQDEAFVSRLLSFSALSDSGCIDYSCWVLFSLSKPKIFNWNTVIRGYSKSKKPNESISLFVKMLRVGVFPDHLTFPFLAKASACLLKRELGLAIHGYITKAGYESDRDIPNARKVFDGIPVKNLVSWNSMLDGYAKCGDISMARQVFDLMPEQDVLSWSCLIDGYVRKGDYDEALAVFEEMRVSGPKPNEVTMVSVLCACAHLGALDKGRMMHHYVIDNELPLTLVLRTSLVDMYAKCGAIQEALHVFRSGLMKPSDVFIWNSMIGGFACHGLVKESLDLFSEMHIVGVKPDEITYLNLLSACAHGGLVKEAWYFFDCLGKNGMTPKSEHYACMVDVMARAGQVAEAYQFLCQIPIQPTASMLGALLNGCMNHGKLDLAETVGRKLIELEPHQDGRYVGLSNVYAIFRRWDKARSMREAMERMGVKKSPGYSFVEMHGALHRFVAHDKSHPSSEQIYMMLGFIVSQMKHIVDYENQEYYFYDNEGKLL
ncbi:hypothetical protein JCGZ_05952 [Jatropha curcas]|uniref:Pentatricopeptide repeat-containing protein n=1 Tax=Jatropha curcas TaxID=180498 RepID=A0A067KR70_JATCU|nr:hypothetical protein JCGZ_05952 [Jatropha curcas]